MAPVLAAAAPVRPPGTDSIRWAITARALAFAGDAAIIVDRMTPDPRLWTVSRRHLVAAALALPVAARGGAAAAPLSPSLSLRAANDRAVAVSVWPARGRRLGTILFSHGALSAPRQYTALIEPWAAAGYDVYAPLHVDSTDHPDTARYPGLASWALRLEDMHLLARHVGRGRYIAAGHSYGGLVALTLGGAAAIRPAGYAGPMRDLGAAIVVAFSPPGPAPGLVDTAGYAALAVPAFVETGDRDVPPGGAPGDWSAHLAAFAAAPAGGHRYGLVLAGVDHYFGNIICRPDRAGPPQTEQFSDASTLAMLFMRAYGLRDTVARVALDRHVKNDGPIGLMVR